MTVRPELVEGSPLRHQDPAPSQALSGTPAIPLFLVFWLAAAIIGGVLAAQPAHPLSDVTHYKLWTRLVTTQGITAMYSGEYPESYVIYPPVTMYGLAVIGHLYQALVDPAFDRDQALASQWLTVAIRLMALSVHLLTGAVIFGLLARRAGPWPAVGGSAMYLLNPGALWDLAVWGQPDAWHSLFALLAFWLIADQSGKRSLIGGALLGLAAMTKPQAWVLLPLAGVAVSRQTLAALSEHRPGGRLFARVTTTGWRAPVVLAALGASIVVSAVLLPFLVSGRWRELLSLPRQISGVMPVASANAHNLWWLVTRGAFPFVLDSEPLGRLALTYRQVALALVLCVLALAAWRAWNARSRWELAGVAAYSGHAWFCLTTGAHENHPFMVFPFLCLVWWRSRFLAFVLVLLIGTFSFNVLVHDLGLRPVFEAALGGWSLRLQMAASALNLLILAAWTIWLLLARHSIGAKG